MSFQIINTDHPEIKLLKPKIFSDQRGYFFENYNKKFIINEIDPHAKFVQENQSMSKFNVLRGLHYQIQHQQIKLVRVLKGEIFDVVVDLRKKSLYFGKWFGFNISSKNKYQIYIPKGFAHGFYVKSNVAIISYKVSDYWYPEYERSILWNDKSLDIKWQNRIKPLISIKDINGKTFKKAEIFL